MKPTKTHYFIFVRPPGSLTWTMHTRTSSAPWRSGIAEEANREAQNIAEHSTFCARVVPIDLPPELDSEQYALFADGDTIYKPCASFLESKASPNG
jgi:hypothetical protein